MNGPLPRSGKLLHCGWMPSAEFATGTEQRLAAQGRVLHVSMHFVVRFEPRPGQAEAFRAALVAVLEPSRAEAGCLAFYAFESLREPIEFGLHSEWLDEAAFERHAQEPHTVRFIEAAERLLTHPVHGLRAHVIGGGPGAGARQ